MKHNLLLVSLALASALPLFAWQRSGEDMSRIAKERLQMMQGPGSLTSLKVNRALDKEMISVYEAEGTGYVVVSRSTTSAPVLGYSDRPFDVNNMPDGLKWWLDQVDRTLAATEATSPANAPESPVSPMLTTRWAQERPFNNLCPLTGMWGTQGQTGCVATAMAQVLNYFKYPVKSTGVGSYSTDGNSFKSVNMNTTFKWDKMRDAYTYGYSDEEATAVAELMRDCGYASKMIYYESGSGALLYDAASGLAHNMQYDSLSMKVKTRMFYRDEEWTDMIHKEIAAGRPILYMGVDPSKMGHAFVLDGMDAEGRVHVNWGWSGDANGYFDISVAKGLTPSYPNPYTGQDIKYCFSDEHAMVIGLNPSSEPAPDAEYESFFAGYEYPELEFINDSLIIETTPVFNFSHLNFKGLLGLVTEGEDGHAVVQPFFYSAVEDGIEIPVLGGIYYPEEYYPQATLCDTDGTTERPDGKYLLYFVSWSEQEMASKINPRYIRYPVELAAPGEENYAVWEAVKVNGHWDPASLRLHQTNIDGIEQLRSEMNEEGATAVAYSLDGRCLGDPQNVGKGMPVVIRKGDKTEKVIVR